MLMYRYIYIIITNTIECGTALKETDAHTIATTLTLALIFQVALQSVIESSI